MYCGVATMLILILMVGMSLQQNHLSCRPNQAMLLFNEKTMAKIKRIKSKEIPDDENCAFLNTGEILRINLLNLGL